MNDVLPDFVASRQFRAMVAKRLAEFGPGTPELNLFVQGNQFQAAGHRSLCGVPGPKGGVELHLAPGVVCYAFASELYQKAMHQIAFGEVPRGHKLNVLFGNLPVAAREVVEGFYFDQTGWDQKQLAKDLLNFNSAFEDWRYVHETDNQHQLRLGALIHFTIALYRAVRSQRPAWPMADLPPYITMPSFMVAAPAAQPQER